MKKILKLFIGVIIFISFGNVYALELPSEPIEPIEPIDSVTMSSFIKKDDKGNIIDSAIFKQTSISGYEMDASINSFLKQKSSQQSQQFIPVTGGNESGNDDHVVYRFINGYNDKEDAYKLLTPDQKAIFDNMQTLNDYNRIKNSVSNSSEDIAYCSGKDAYVTYLKESKGIVASEFHDFNGTPDNPSTDPSVFNYTYGVLRLQATQELPRLKTIAFHILTYTFIEETRTPQGLEKTNIVVPMEVFLIYTVNADDTLELTDGSAKQYFNLLKYNPDINYNDVSDVYNKMDDSLIFGLDESQTGCLNTNLIFYDTSACDFTPVTHSPASGAVTIPSTSDSSPQLLCTSIVVDKTSTENLSKKVEIQAFVDGKKEVSVKRSEEVTITVKVYNGAKAPLYTNRVVSNLPKDLTYVESSAIKGGTYDAANRTITWNLDYLDSFNSELLSYKVRVPDNAKDGTTVTTQASFYSSDIQTPVVSNEAKVDVGNVKNPKTGVMNTELITIILAISILGVLLVMRKDSIKSI